MELGFRLRYDLKNRHWFAIQMSNVSIIAKSQYASSRKVSLETVIWIIIIVIIIWGTTKTSEIHTEHGVKHNKNYLTQLVNTFQVTPGPKVILLIVSLCIYSHTTFPEQNPLIAPTYHLAEIYVFYSPMHNTIKYSLIFFVNCLKMWIVYKNKYDQDHKVMGGK